jgi:hypothetical protein
MASRTEPVARSDRMAATLVVVVGEGVMVAMFEGVRFADKRAWDPQFFCDKQSNRKLV